MLPVPLESNRSLLCVLLPLRPPCLHHRRQFLPHGCAHRLPTGGFLGWRCGLCGGRLASPFCPALFHRGRDALPGSRTHTPTFRAAWRSCRCCLLGLGWTALACGL